MEERPPLEERPRRPAARGDTTPAAPATRRLLVHGDLVRQVVRSCHIVHQTLGGEYLESVYEAAVAKVLRTNGVVVERQRALDVVFWGEVVGAFRIDLLVDGVLLVEFKAVREIAPEHHAQVLNYLRASELRVGLLVNFGRQLQVKRFVR